MANPLVLQIVLPLALFLIMLGVGMSLRVKDFQTLTRQPRAIFVGVLGQIVLLPLLACLILLLFALPPLLAMGIMILTFAPGGASSNLITYLCRGDTALSVCLTTVAGLITPFTLPVLTMLALDYWLDAAQIIDFPILVTMGKLLAIGVVPVILGMMVSHYQPVFCAKIQKPIKIIATLFLVLIVVGIVKANWQELPDQVVTVGPAVLTLVLVAMLSGFWLAKRAALTSAQGVTLAIEVGIQNSATALLVTGGILNNPEMSASVLIYGVLMNIPVAVLIIYRNWNIAVSKQQGSST